MGSTLHITPGHVDTALCCGSSNSPSLVGPLSDSLDFGPLKAFDNLESWRALRDEFWRSFEDWLEYGTCSKKRKRKSQRENRMRDLLDEPGYIVDAENVVLWLGTCQAEQLTLAWIPQLLRALGVPPERLSVVQYLYSRSGKELLTLNVVPKAEYGFAPAAKTLYESDLAYLDRAWAALTSPDPPELLGFLEKGGSPFPLLSRAVRHQLVKYPDHRSGINTYEARMLANVSAHGPRASSVIGQSLIDTWNESDRIGDGTLFWRMLRLSDPALPQPAVALGGRRTGMHDTEVRLTEFGERVVRGEANFVEANGIDDWVGGVHLDSKVGNVWFHRDVSLVRG